MAMERAERRERPVQEGTSLWYKDAIIYEVHVRAFFDSNADGIGDFRGLVERLDYLQDLGVTAIWLLPFYPSPLRDDGYDISDYKDVNPSYGSLRDFRFFLREARRRGLRVITELVVNHTSDQHPWFQRARRAPAGTEAREFYVWSDTPDRYQDARIIFKDFETSNWAWDRVAQAYYWHRFYSHQPDLNFDNPEVGAAIKDAMDFWLDMGVDGFRLDAVPYLFEREGTSSENLPETLEFLTELRKHVDATYQDRLLLAEANQWPEDAVAYFGNGDRCHMAFHFPLMPRMFMAIRMEDRFPVIDILEQTPPVPDIAQWAIFLRNHDELTLEMVTDEERDYMYRAYAEDTQARINLGIRRRLAPLLGNNRRLIEMINGLLFSLPGTPVVYYGDEIGMGDNIYLGDRDSVRTPMQWSADRNAGFSRANPQKLYLPVIIDPEYHSETVNVEAQQNNPHSLLWFMKRLIGMRKRYRAFGRGTLEFLYPENRKVLTYLRCFEDERVLVVANLSRFAQYVELDLSAYRDMVPVEVFGHTEFPRIGELPYLLTLSPYAFHWFSLEARRAERGTRLEGRLPVVEASGPWSEFLQGSSRRALEAMLPAYLQTRRWFGGKARRIRSATIAEVIPVPAASPEAREPVAFLTMVQVEYTEGEAETYVLPLAAGEVQQGEDVNLQSGFAHHVLGRLRSPEGVRVVFDALWEPAFGRALLDAIARRRRLAGSGGQLVAAQNAAFRRVAGQLESAPQPAVVGAEQSNTSVAYGDRLILKLFRRPDLGENPDLEIGRFLTERAAFPHTPPVAGWLEYRPRESRVGLTLGVLQGFVHNEGDAWQYTLDALEGYMEQAMAHPEDAEPDLPDGHVLDLAEHGPPQEAVDLIGPYLESARLLGQRTAELHVALASDPNDPAFAPEPFTTLYQRSMYQSMRNLTGRTFRLLRSIRQEVPQVIQVLDLENEILGRMRTVTTTRIGGQRIRCHGDYHLGQVLFTGRDFVIIDFEGEPARPLTERRIKRSPLRDVAGMLRSYHYAAYTSMYRQDGAVPRPENPSFIEPWTLLWYRWVSAEFIRSYLETAGPAGFLPSDRTHVQVLLDGLVLEKAVYELAYEANNRPDWVRVPIKGILQILEGAP